MHLNNINKNHNGYAVIFDMDGVICHTNPHHARAFEIFFDKYQIPYTEQELVKHMYGKHNSYIMSYFFKRQVNGEELIALESEKEALFREIYRERVAPLPCYIGFLQDLKTSGFKTAVATSAPQANLDLIVDVLTIREVMDSLMASENVTLHKPHPEVYLKSAKNMQVNPSHCLVFEDSFSGVTAALNAGMKVVGVLSSHTKDELPPCSHYIRDYSEINADKVLDILKG